MRVAMVSMHTSPADRPGKGDAGGLNVYVLETARALAERGHQIDIFTRAPAAPSTRSLAPGVTLFALEAGRGIVRKHDLANLSEEFGDEIQRVASVASESYDVLHTHYWLSGLAALPVSLALGIPIAQTFHTLEAMKMSDFEASVQEPNRRMLTERYLAYEADAVVAVSSAETNTLIDALGAQPESVWLVPPAVDTELFRIGSLSSQTSVRASLGLGVFDELVITVGRIQPLKGQDHAIRMLPYLPGVVLAIVGEATPDELAWAEDLEVLASELGVADRVRFVGSLGRERLAAFLAAASATIIPSHSETFGLVALESAAAGTPVIAQNTGGLRDSVAHGSSGLLIDGRDPQRWAEAVRELLDDAPRLHRMGAAAREFASERTWAKSAETLEGVYERMIESRP
ncbi:glycosyltransferase [Humidisolicoccus flavus]|uniref:glycosyltransferase n=1 Tax=Humidisolicoccus flavus TaxID=3111414 RepID=UPI003243CF77